uniref:Retrotrans_gag domain-containing protein n=1 Tax=Anopheles merus TaxID=30066 RepID=A0A182VIV1_ANOME
MTMSCEQHVNDYDPESAELTAKEWLDIVKQFGHSSALSGDQLYSFARGKLQGSAKTWLNRSKVSSWEEFQHTFVKAFPENEFNSTSRKARQRALERRKKLPNESLDEYTEEMQRLGKHMNLPEETIVCCIVAGLQDPILSKSVPFGTSLKQLKNAIHWQEELDGLMRQYNESKLTLDHFETLADRMEDIVLGGENLTETLHGNPQVLQVVGKELSSLLRCHRMAVSCNLSDLGISKTHQIVVQLKTPTVSRELDTVKLSDCHAKSRLLQSSLISHLTCDVIRKMSSSTAPPLFHPMHHFDAQSIVLDLSHLNGAIHREPPNYLVPEPLLPALAAFRYFTTLDFDAGHLQIPLEPDSQRYFTFATPFGPFQLQRAPKHFTNTTAVFNKILIELARKLPTGDVVVLNDTLVLPSRDTAEGLPQLARVLSALTAFGLTAILRRCRFFEAQIQLHNWIVQQGKVSSIGLPFRLPVAAGYRLVLAISESSTGKTFESLLRKENGASEARPLPACHNTIIIGLLRSGTVDRLDATFIMPDAGYTLGLMASDLRCLFPTPTGPHSTPLR